MSVSTAPVRLTVHRFGETSRRDAWWIQPLVVFLGLSTFLVYSTWAAFHRGRDVPAVAADLNDRFRAEQRRGPQIAAAVGAKSRVRPVRLAVLLSRNLRRLTA